MPNGAATLKGQGLVEPKKTSEGVRVPDDSKPSPSNLSASTLIPLGSIVVVGSLLWWVAAEHASVEHRITNLESIVTDNQAFQRTQNQRMFDKIDGIREGVHETQKSVVRLESLIRDRG